jgi:hypothetical protein
MLYPNLDENMIDVDNSKNKIQIRVGYETDLRAKNISISTPLMDTEFNLVRVPLWMRALAVQHPQFNPDEILGNEMLRMQYTRKYWDTY